VPLKEKQQAIPALLIFYSTFCRCP